MRKINGKIFKEENKTAALNVQERKVTDKSLTAHIGKSDESDFE